MIVLEPVGNEPAKPSPQPLTPGARRPGPALATATAPSGARDPGPALATAAAASGATPVPATPPALRFTPRSPTHLAHATLAQRARRGVSVLLATSLLGFAAAPALADSG